MHLNFAVEKKRSFLKIGLLSRIIKILPTKSQQLALSSQVIKNSSSVYLRTGVLLKLPFQKYNNPFLLV